MIEEIDAGTIIAIHIIINQKRKIFYDELYEIARKIENDNFIYRCDCDSISIDAFRCDWPEYIECYDNYLIIKKFKTMKNTIINRYFPSDKILHIFGYER